MPGEIFIGSLTSDAHSISIWQIFANECALVACSGSARFPAACYNSPITSFAKSLLDWHELARNCFGRRKFATSIIWHLCSLTQPGSDFRDCDSHFAAYRQSGVDLTMRNFRPFERATTYDPTADVALSDVNMSTAELLRMPTCCKLLR